MVSTVANRGGLKVSTVANRHSHPVRLPTAKV